MQYAIRVIINIQATNVGRLYVQVASDMETLSKSGINSFKFFLAYKGALMVTDDELLHGLYKCKDIGVLAMVSLIYEIISDSQMCSYLQSKQRHNPILVHIWGAYNWQHIMLPSCTCTMYAQTHMIRIYT